MDIHMNTKSFFNIKLIPLLFALLAMCIYAHAEVTSYATSIEFTQKPLYRINHQLQYFDNENDYIAEGKPLEVQIRYSCEDISEWNTNYANYSIQYINLTIIKLERAITQGNRIDVTTTTDVIRLDTMQNPFHNAKHFIQLRHRETLTTELNTYYTNTTIADSPCTFDIILPTWSCNACEEYEYAQQEQDITLTQNINDDRNTIYTHTKRLIYINYEILLILYYATLISAVIALIALITYSLIFIYKYIKRLITS